MLCFIAHGQYSLGNAIMPSIQFDQDNPFYGRLAFYRLNVKHFGLILLSLPAQARGQLHRRRYGTCAFFSLSNHPCEYHQLQLGSDDRIYLDLKKRPHHKKGKTQRKGKEP